MLDRLTREAPAGAAMRRTAETRPLTWDAQARTVEAVIATPTPVRRMDAQGPFLEILDAATLDLRGAEGLAVIDSHRTDSGRHVLGRVEKVWRDGKNVMARLRITAAADAEWARERIADGSLTGVSIGYAVAAWSTARTRPDMRTKSPTSWRLTEITLTSNPADPLARLRQGEHGGAGMDPETIEEDTGQTRQNPPNDGQGQSRQDAERERRSEIRALVRHNGLDTEVADDLIDQNATTIEARAAILDAINERSRQAPRIRVHGGGGDDPAVVRQRQADALVYRMQGGELAEHSRQFVNMSLRDIATDALTRSGQSVAGLSADEVFQRAAHTTSDFPLVVSNAATNVALASYQAAESPLKRVCRQRTLPNFKPSAAIRVGEAGQLEPLAENGEITHTSRGEAGETMRLKTFARALNVSRELLVNDDLGLLGDMTAALGEAAAQTEASILVDLVTANPNLSDGTAVFDASRGNTAAGALDEAGLSAARLAMRKRVGVGGQPIAVAPKFLVVPPELETTAEKLLAAITPTKTEDANVAARDLELLVEPRLGPDDWFVFADPARLAALSYAYLSAAQGVQIQRQEQWNTLGLSFRAFLDFGAGWLDWRGAQRVEAA